MRHIVVQEAPFDVAEEYTRLKTANLKVGAVATFVGAVRDLNEGVEIAGLHLEHYPGMTEKEIDRIIEEAEERWDVIAATVIHRVGDLSPGDDIVYAGIASQHRSDAFAACEFVMDFLKTRATFWKKETTTDGDRWLTTRQSDVDAAEAWCRDD